MAAEAHVDEWAVEDVGVAEIERQLTLLRTASAAESGAPGLRTSVMTHMAWVPQDWLEAATRTLAGLAERHPSRTILLVPDPEGTDRIDAEVSLRCFPLDGQIRHVSSEVIRLRLGGRRAEAPASIVTPLLITDLPAFLRWRGQPPFGAPALEQLVGVADRLVVDSSEWDDLPAAYARLAELFERTAVSDIAWRRTLEWRGSLARLWPEIAKLSELRAAGPYADALLLASWLRTRLQREVELVHDEADEVEIVAVDGRAVTAPRGDPMTPSDLLSAELDDFGRDPIYEEAVRAA